MKLTCADHSGVDGRIRPVGRAVYLVGRRPHVLVGRCIASDRSAIRSDKSDIASATMCNRSDWRDLGVVSILIRSGTVAKESIGDSINSSDWGICLTAMTVVACRHRRAAAEVAEAATVSDTARGIVAVVAPSTIHMWCSSLSLALRISP